MYRHPLDRPPENKEGSIRSWLKGFDWEDVFVFVHITLAVIFVIWGLELILPWSVWRILLGIYLGLWVGSDLLKQLWGKGIYLLSGGGTSGEE